MSQLVSVLYPSLSAVRVVRYCNIDFPVKKVAAAAAVVVVVVEGTCLFSLS